MVNTFVTSTSLKECAKNLDNLRLNKQIVEGTQIIRILETVDKSGKPPSGKGFINHPATKMWMGHTNHLKIYVNHMIREWVDIRGKNHSIKQFPVDESKYQVATCTFDGKLAQFDGPLDEYCFPKWFSFPPFIMAHKASLYRKNPRHYEFLLSEELKPFIATGYLWPSKYPNCEYLQDWKMDYLAEIGAGAPPQYRYTREELTTWYEEKGINPKTGRKIQSNGSLYLSLSKAYEFHFKQTVNIQNNTDEIDEEETSAITTTTVSRAEPNHAAVNAAVIEGQPHRKTRRTK